MNQPLQVLIVEDDEDEALLVELELKRAGYDIIRQRVQTSEEMREAIGEKRWDLVIADYDLKIPQFDGLAALSLVKELGMDVPFIIVSGHITEETAVRAMKAGAHDFVMKEKLARLGPAVERELRETQIRRENRLSEARLKVEQAFREAIENSIPSGIAAVDLEGRQSYVNPAFCAMVGWREAELLGARPPFAYWPPEEVNAIADAMGRVVDGTIPSDGVELRFRKRNDERIDVLLQITGLRDHFGNVTGWISSALDITERKRADVRLAAEHAITRILANAQTLEEAAPGIVQVLLDGLEVDVGALWVVDPKHQLLQPSVMNLRLPSPSLQFFLQESRRLSFPCGNSLPGRVWKQGKAAWVEDVGEDPHFQRQKLAAKAGLCSGLAFPIQSGGDFFGVLEFLTLRKLPRQQSLLNMMTAIGSEIGQFIKRRRAEEALRRAHNELEVRVQQRTADLKSANMKLHSAITERKRLEHELLEITENERRRIGLDLHDDLGQKLSGLALMTKGLELKLTKKQAGEAKDAGKIHGLMQQAMNHARELAKDLATLELKEKDLSAALSGLAAHAGKLFQITCQFKVKGEIPALEGSVINQLYKIAQEAVTNAIKHGKAKRVGIGLANGADKVVLTVENNGAPFPDLKSRTTGIGLRIMNYRASLIGADLDIKGTGAKGTRVTCSVPIEGKKA